MAEIVEVIDAGPGWTQVRDSEGNVFRMEGARNWRNNNPGNLEYGNFAKSLGAVGSDGRFAVFPSYEAGRQAKEQLIFSSPSYRDLTLEQAISRYAPPNENNTRSYINQVAAAAGVPASTPMSQIPQSVRGNMLNAMERVEGFSPGRTYNAQGIPVPPMEIPNTVASALSVRPPAPTPAQQSPDLSLMRNPLMSSAARMAQVTPPLPQRRPASPMDIARAPGTTIDTIPTSNRPGQSQIERITPMPSAREIASAPGVTVATIPTSNIGRPPTTRVVQSVPNPMQPTAREIAEARGTTVATIPTATSSQVQQAARRAALTANQSYVDRTLPPRANTPGGSAVNNIREQQLEQLGQRAATNIPARLSPGVAAQNYDVAINGPPGLTRQQFAALPMPPVRAGLAAPTPLPANARPLASPSLAPARTLAPAPQAAPAPLRIVVNGGNQVASALATQPVAPQPMTVVQALRSQGLSPSDAYDVANQRAREQAYERANGPDTRSDYFKSVTGG